MQLQQAIFFEEFKEIYISLVKKNAEQLKQIGYDQRDNYFYYLKDNGNFTIQVWNFGSADKSIITNYCEKWSYIFCNQLVYFDYMENEISITVFFLKSNYNNELIEEIQSELKIIIETVKE